MNTNPTPHGMDRLKWTCQKCRVWFADKPDWCPRCFGITVSGRKSALTQEGLIHGRRSTYRRYRCRCEPCRLSARAYERAYVEQNREARRASNRASKKRQRGEKES